MTSNNNVVTPQANWRRCHRTVGVRPQRGHPTVNLTEQIYDDKGQYYFRKEENYDKLIFYAGLINPVNYSGVRLRDMICQLGRCLIQITCFLLLKCLRSRSLWRLFLLSFRPGCICERTEQAPLYMSSRTFMVKVFDRNLGKNHFKRPMMYARLA